MFCGTAQLILIIMGNLETLCNIEKQPANHVELGEVLLQITENRKELKELPRAPINIQEIILRLLRVNKFQQIYKDTKIWKVSSPYRFCYINQSQDKDKPPFGICSIYLYKQKGEFVGFYRGMVSEKGLRQVKGCIYVFANGDYFVGDKQKQNFGVYTDKQNKYQYEGDWVSGRPHGEGKEQSAKGVYHGYFKNGKKNGKGKFQFVGEDPIVYEGDFLDNQMTGQGKLTKSKSGYEYSGQFLRGQRHGLGIQKMGTMSIMNYDGYFLCDKKSGMGKLVGKNFVYQGEFLEGQPNGKGVMKREEKKIEGIWEKGELKAVLGVSR